MVYIAGESGAIEVNPDGIRSMGIDLSLTSTGIGMIDPVAGLWWTALVCTSPPRVALPGRHRAQGVRISHIARRVAEDVCDAAPDVIAMEGPSLMSRGGLVHERAGAWWHVYLAIEGVADVQVVPPASLKRRAAGSGRAGKAEVGAAVRAALGPGVRLQGAGWSDKTDALALALVGAGRL